MRIAFLLLTVSLLVPAVAAEFGAYGADGWPIATDGTSTNPFPGLSAADFDAALGDPLNQAAGVTVYPYWPLLTLEVQRLAADHPDRVRLHIAGQSTLGLDLYMLEIADFAAIEAGAGTPLEEREVVWVDGGHHSNEYSGVYFALAWAQYLIEEYGQDDNATWIVDNRHSWVMPMVNPDGSHAFGRLNANGVNINRNYPVIWDGVGNDAVMNNRGPSPASEVETQINIEWFNVTRPDYYASVHCCGNLWLYPYGEEGIDPIDNPMLQSVCEEAFPAVREACGPIWSTIYPASGSSVDTAYEYAGIVAFGYEMSGRGAVSLWGQPLTFESVRTQEIESWTGVLHAALNVHRYGALPVITDVAVAGNDFIVQVRNDGLGNLTKATLRLNDGAAMPIPDITPGNQTTVRVAGARDGNHELTIDYAKRLVATSNLGQRVTSVAVNPEPNAAATDFVVASKTSSDAPGLPVTALVVLLGALAVALRRR